MAAAPSPALDLFLSHRPGEHGLKQAGRAVDAHLDAAHHLLHATALESCQRIAFVLAELRGLVASTPECASLGVNVRSPPPLCAGRSSADAHLRGVRAGVSRRVLIGVC